MKKNESLNQSINQSKFCCKGGLIRTSLDKSRTRNMIDPAAVQTKKICSYRESDYENINSNKEDSPQLPYVKGASGNEVEEDNVNITNLTRL
jgi:hypothetical protein